MLERYDNSSCPKSSADHVETQEIAITNKRPLGQPRVLTKTFKEEICTRIMDGETLRDICSDRHIPAERTVYRTLAAEGEEEFRQQYVRARSSSCAGRTTCWRLLTTGATTGSRDAMLPAR
jgi:hypothetical protein